MVFCTSSEKSSSQPFVAVRRRADGATLFWRTESFDSRTSLGQAMSPLDRLVSQLFRSPGSASAGTRQFLGRAASAHFALLERAAADASQSPSVIGELPRLLLSQINRLPSRAARQRLLLDPAFIEGLHAAAAISPSLTAWHACVAEPSIATICPATTPQHAHRLGNSLLCLRLREDSAWQGELALRTDHFGRLRFPLSDWSIELLCRDTAPHSVLADESVTVTLDRHSIRFAVDRADNENVLVVPRSDWLRMLIANDGAIDGSNMNYPSRHVMARMHFAGRIPGWRVLYDSMTFTNPAHAGITGGLTAAILNAIRNSSPTIAAEFDRLLTSIRGWELPPAAYGTIQSFSDPTLPRVMNLNVSYADEDAAQIDRFCFTWFGHELGHTKSYLIETILHVAGFSLTPAHGEYTQFVERYNRRLPIRTLLQIPYTHLYEWSLLVAAMQNGFTALPWLIDDDPIAFGDDLRAEIEEAFDRINQEVLLTDCGHVVLGRLWALSTEVLSHWKRLRGLRRPTSQETRSRPVEGTL